MANFGLEFEKEEKEILKLKRMLEEAEIPFEFTDDAFDVVNDLENVSWREYRCLYPAYQITINDKYGFCLCDCVQNNNSYGNSSNLLEIMGGVTSEEEFGDDLVLGYLTAEEVFKRFKYCYEHGSVYYVEEENNEK